MFAHHCSTLQFLLQLLLFVSTICFLLRQILSLHPLIQAFLQANPLRDQELPQAHFFPFLVWHKQS